MSYDRRRVDTAPVAGDTRRRGMHEIRDVLGGRTPTHLHLRNRLGFVVGATVALDAVASVLVLLVERNTRGTEITNIGDALFWTTSQLLTVSSQMSNPVSTSGRIIDIFLEAYAISVVAVLAGSFGAFFHRRSEERAPVQPGSG
jgi:hypothetical protein